MILCEGKLSSNLVLREPFLLLFELREELPMVQGGLSLTFHSPFITLRGPSQTQEFSPISWRESLDHQKTAQSNNANKNLRETDKCLYYDHFMAV